MPGSECNPSDGSWCRRHRNNITTLRAVAQSLGQHRPGYQRLEGPHGLLRSLRSNNRFLGIGVAPATQWIPIYPAAMQRKLPMPTDDRRISRCAVSTRHL